VSYRLLHFADLHLERAFSQVGCRGAVAKRRRHGLRMALRAIGNAAGEHSCNAVTIGGDLFEHERATLETAQFLAQTFASWQPIEVFIAPGNHDPVDPSSIYLHQDWPSNVHIFLEETLTPVALEDGLTLWGLGHPGPRWFGSPFERHAEGSGLHVALFHGAEQSSVPEGKSMHGPFHAPQIIDSGFVAALCGHYHGRTINTEFRLVYPGSPEPLTFDEAGEKGPVLVEIEPSGAVHYTPLSSNQWNVLSVVADVGDALNTTALLERVVEDARRSLGSRDPESTSIRVDVVGSVDSAITVTTADIEQFVRDSTDIAAVLIRNRLSTAVDLASLRTELTARGTFVRSITQQLDAASNEQDRRILEDALTYGLHALAGNEIPLR